MLLVQDGQKKRKAGFHALEHPGIRIVGANDGGPNAGGFLFELDAKRLVEADGGPLRRAIVRESRNAEEAPCRGNRNHVSTPALDHAWQERFRHPEQGQRVHVEALFDLLVRDFEERLAANDASIINEDVHRPFRRRGRVNRRALGDVADSGGGFPSERFYFGLHGLEPLTVQVPKSEHPAATRDAQSHAPSDAARRTRDQNARTLKLSHGESDSILYTRRVPIRTKRVYEAASAEDGKRFLVDRLWPRGVAKNRVYIEAWLPELGPSHALRRWFAHDPAKWSEFKKRYSAELAGRSELWASIVAASKSGIVTLVYSARDEDHNQAVALAAYLRQKGQKTRRK